MSIVTATAPTALAECTDCGGRYHRAASNLPWTCLGCGDTLDSRDLRLEANEYEAPVVDADRGGELLGWIVAAESWMWNGSRQIAESDARVGAVVATPEHGPVTLTQVFPEAHTALAQWDGPVGLVTYVFTVDAL